MSFFISRLWVVGLQERLFITGTLLVHNHLSIDFSIPLLGGSITTASNFPYFFIQEAA